MYLDTDCILALVKEKDWLKNSVKKRIRKEKKLYTSVLSVVESRLVLIREENIDVALYVEDKLKNLNIKLLPLDEKILKRSNELMQQFDFLGTFDSLHIACAKLHGEKILSTDHIFEMIPGLSVEDPRNV